MSSFTLLAQIRPTELWTPLSVTAGVVLLVLVVVLLAWVLGVVTSRYDRES